MKVAVSYVIPFVDEEATLVELYQRIAAVSGSMVGPGEAWEVVFVDDGSTDGSAAVVEALCAEHPEVRLIQLTGNFGKSAALAAGFDHARGEVVFTLDADLQDVPEEAPRLLAKLDEGYDLVTGWKKDRRDPLGKVIPSRVFNWLVRRMTGLRLHDINCGFKVYRRPVVDNLRIYGELHRFTPALAHWRRFKVAELPVEHQPRTRGKSKFGGGRFFRGLVDLFTVFFLLKYDRRPAHFFGLVGLLAFVAGVAICGYLTALKIGGEGIGHRPLLMLGVLLIVVGLQVMLTGLLAELIVHPGRHETPYVARRVIGGPGEEPAVDVDQATPRRRGGHLRPR